MVRLCLILSGSPNVRKMILTDCGNNDLYPTYQLYPHDLWKKNDLRPFKVCKLSISEHISFNIHPSPPDQKAPCLLPLAILTSSTAETTIAELAILHSGGDAFLTQDVFVMTARQSCCLTLQCQHLTKLQMRFG